MTDDDQGNLHKAVTAAILLRFCGGTSDPDLIAAAESIAADHATVALSVVREAMWEPSEAWFLAATKPLSNNDLRGYESWVSNYRAAIAASPLAEPKP